MSFKQHDLVIAADLVEGPRQMPRRILLIAHRIFAPRPRHPARRIEQAFAVGVVAGPADQGPHRLADLLGHRHLGRRSDQVAVFRTTASLLNSSAMASATAAAWTRMSGTAIISQ